MQQSYFSFGDESIFRIDVYIYILYTIQEVTVQLACLLFSQHISDMVNKKHFIKS